MENGKTLEMEIKALKQSRIDKATNELVNLYAEIISEASEYDVSVYEVMKETIEGEIERYRSLGVDEDILAPAEKMINPIVELIGVIEYSLKN